MIKAKKLVLIFSKELIKEFIEVVKRPIQDIFSNDDVEQLLYTFHQFAELITVTSKFKLCRDEKDNFLLNLAVDGKADFLVTGDKDLLILEQIKKTKILTYKDLLEIL